MKLAELQTKYWEILRVVSDLQSQHQDMLDIFSVHLLKPCPACSEQAHMVQEKRSMFIRCKKCGLKGPNYPQDPQKLLTEYTDHCTRKIVAWNEIPRENDQAQKEAIDKDPCQYDGGSTSHGFTRKKISAWDELPRENNQAQKEAPENKVDNV